jgi:hypothetical protein
VLPAHLAVLVTGRSNISHSRNLETERGSPRRHSVGRGARLLFDIAVGFELFEVGPKVVDLLIVLELTCAMFLVASSASDTLLN